MAVCALLLAVAPGVGAAEAPPPAAALDGLDDADLVESWKLIKAATVLCWRNDAACFVKIGEAIDADQTLVMPSPPDAPKSVAVAPAFDGMFPYPGDAWAFATVRLMVKKGKCDERARQWQLPTRPASSGGVARAFPVTPQKLIQVAKTQITQAAWRQDWDELERIEAKIESCTSPKPKVHE